MGRATPRGRPGRLDSESSWIKSSLSFSNGNCVEVASLPDGEIGVRDSKASDGPVLRFTSDQWHAFLGRVRNGEFDKFSQAWPPQDTGHVPSLQAWPSASPAAADQQDGPPHQDNRAGRGRRPSAFAAAGAAAAAIPAAPAIALAATAAEDPARRPDGDRRGDGQVHRRHPHCCAARSGQPGGSRGCQR